MKLFFLILLVSIFIGIFGYVAAEILKKRVEQKSIWITIGPYIFFFFIAILTLNFWKSIVGIYKTEILVHNGNYRNVLNIEVNGKTVKIAPNKIDRIRTNKSKLRLVFDTQHEKIDTIIGTGYYAINSGKDYYLILKERKFRSLRNGSALGDNQEFYGRLDGQIIKLSDYNDCIVLDPRANQFITVSGKYKGKRIFSSTLNRK